MLLYTIMPYEAVFPPQCDMQIETRRIKGGYVELLSSPGGRTVSRVIATDPKLYLKGLSPGDKYL
jgi:hypothetical protein